MNNSKFRYTNTKESFKKWCRDYEPLTRGSNVEYHRDGNVFLCLEHIKEHDSAFGKIDFVGLTLREYDESEHDFVVLREDKKQMHVIGTFAEVIRRYEQTYSTKYYG